MVRREKQPNQGVPNQGGPNQGGPNQGGDACLEARRRRGARSQRRGWWAEWLSAWILRLKGYRILERRWRSPFGEIDLLARRGSVVVVVEVKARPNEVLGREAVSTRQWVRLSRAVAFYVARRPKLAMCDIRFDVMVVTPRRWPRHVVDAWRA
ncbi:putative endonuclease [Azospirillaceae bacterium]